MFLDFLNGWRKIKEVPEWVQKAWLRKGRSYGPRTWYFKGKTFLYKIRVGAPQHMGHMPTTYYRKLRKK
ncbi:hypothetical protein J4209_01165 [Candidatus Woesearchaeota archaeon]|nr:hypothetical protein [Candidatus Woesearchaeota archaeon]